MEKINVVIIEDQAEIANDVVQMLAKCPDIQLCAHYFNAEYALKNLKQDEPHVYLVDIGLPGISGIDFISQAAQLTDKSEFIVHTISENSRDLLNAISVGAAGYIIKGTDIEELSQSIKTVVSGGGLISPRMARRLFHYFKNMNNVNDRKILTKTEIDILTELKAGSSYEKIAENKNVSLSTVQTHIKNIYKKLKVNNKKDAVMAGAIYGLY